MSFGGARCPPRLDDISLVSPRSIKGLAPGSVVDLPLYARSQLNPVVVDNLSLFAREHGLFRRDPDVLFINPLLRELKNDNVRTVIDALRLLQDRVTFSFGSTPKPVAILSDSGSDNENPSPDNNHTASHALVTVNVFEGGAGGEHSLSVNDSDDESGADPGEIRQFVCPNCGSQASEDESGGESEGQNGDETEAEGEEDEGPDEDDGQEWEEEGTGDEQEGETADGNHAEQESEEADEFGEE